MAKNDGEKTKQDSADKPEPVFVRPRNSTIDHIINLIDDCLGAENEPTT
jgi:hypothetical protein